MAQVGQKRAWSETREECLLAQLHNGVEGSTVLEGLVQKNGKTYSLASLSTMFSNLRSKFMQNRPPEHRLLHVLAGAAQVHAPGGGKGGQ